MNKAYQNRSLWFQKLFSASREKYNLTNMLHMKNTSYKIPLQCSKRLTFNKKRTVLQFSVWINSFHSGFNPWHVNGLVFCILNSPLTWIFNVDRENVTVFRKNRKLTSLLSSKLQFYLQKYQSNLYQYIFYW